MHVRLLGPCFKTGRMEPCGHYTMHARMRQRYSPTLRWATISSQFSSRNAMPMVHQARSIACSVLMTSSTIAKCSRQAHSQAAISPHYTDPLHFPFSMFRHYYLSLQSPVSPFPHGTCSLGVSNKDTALHELYHLFHALFPRCMTHRRYTVH